MSGVEAVLGFVSAGAGLPSLALQLSESIQKLKAFSEKVKGSHRMLHDLIFDLETMTLCLDQVERHPSRDTEDADLVCRCLGRCRTATSRIQRVIDGLQGLNAKHARLGKFITAFKDPEISSLLVELDQARSSLSVSLLMFYSQQQARQQDAQHQLLQHQTTQLELIWTHTQANGTALPRMISHSTQHDVKAEGARVIDSLANVPVEAKGPARRGRCRNGTHFNIRLPQWISDRVWNISTSWAESGWDLKLRTYMIRPVESEIFHRCMTGITRAVQRLISQGQASPWDITGEGFRVEGIGVRGAVSLLQVNKMGRIVGVMAQRLTSFQIALIYN